MDRTVGAWFIHTAARLPWKKNTNTGNTHGSLKKPTPPVADNEVGLRFELLKIARCQRLCHLILMFVLSADPHIHILPAALFF